MTSRRRVSFTPGPARSLIARWPNGKIAKDDDALRMLRRIGRLARTPDDPLALSFDQRGVEAFDGFLAGLHADRRRTEGLEAAWLGKGWSTVARLAGALELLAWSGTGRAGSARPYRPRAGRGCCGAAGRAISGRTPARVFECAAPSDFDGRGKAGGPLAQGRWRRRWCRARTSGARRGPGGEYRGHQHGLAVSTFSALSVPIAATTHEGPGRPASRRLVHPALKDREIVSKMKKMRKSKFPAVRPTSRAADGRSPSTPPPGVGSTTGTPISALQAACGSAPCRRSP